MADVRIAGKVLTSAASYTDTRCLAPDDPLPPRTALRLVMGRVRAEIQRWPISWPERNRLLSGIGAAVHRALSDGGRIPRGRAEAIAGEGPCLYPLRAGSLEERRRAMLRELLEAGERGQEGGGEDARRARGRGPGPCPPAAGSRGDLREPQNGGQTFQNVKMGVKPLLFGCCAPPSLVGVKDVFLVLQGGKK